MAITSPNLSSSWLSSNSIIRRTPAITSASTLRSTLKKMGSSCSLSTSNSSEETKKSAEDLTAPGSGSSRPCPCCYRRRFLGSVLGTGLSPVSRSFASMGDSTTQDPSEMLKRIRPPRSDWYEEFYASAMDKLMKSYEKEITGYKSELFANLRGKADKILEIGVGTGPNLKYYADYPGITVFGVDPNRKMEKYARAAAEAAGLPSSNFRFMQSVGEALPVDDSSVDAVVGTLVLCSVKDVDQTLQEVRRVLKPGGLYIFVEHVGAEGGTFLRFVQGALDPLQQTIADGCHLTRNTATNIAKAGFAGVDVNEAFLSAAIFVNPQIYGIAYK